MVVEDKTKEKGTANGPRCLSARQRGMYDRAAQINQGFVVARPIGNRVRQFAHDADMRWIW